MEDKFFEIPDSKYSEGIILEEYQGSWSLVSGRTGTDGKNYKKWGFPQGKDKEAIGKAIPWKIYLGPSRKAAIDMLRKIAMELKE